MDADQIGTWQLALWGLSGGTLWGNAGQVL